MIFVRITRKNCYSLNKRRKFVKSIRISNIRLHRGRERGEFRARTNRLTQARMADISGTIFAILSSNSNFLETPLLGRQKRKGKKEKNQKPPSSLDQLFCRRRGIPEDIPGTTTTIRVTTLYGPRGQGNQRVDDSLLVQDGSLSSKLRHGVSLKVV